MTGLFCLSVPTTGKVRHESCFLNPFSQAPPETLSHAPEYLAALPNIGHSSNQHRGYYHVWHALRVGGWRVGEKIAGRVLARIH